MLVYHKDIAEDTDAHLNESARAQMLGYCCDRPHHVFGLRDWCEKELEDCGHGMDTATSSVNRAYWVTVLKTFQREARTLTRNCLLEVIDA